MHDLASPLSADLDLPGTFYFARKQEARDALECLLRLMAAAVPSLAVAVVMVDGEVERSVSTLGLASYESPSQHGISSKVSSVEHTITFSGNQLESDGVVLPLQRNWASWTFCLRRLRARWGNHVGVIWIAREQSEPFLQHELALFEQSAVLVERELGFLARQEDIIVQRERATAEVAQLHEQLHAQTISTRLQALVESLDDGILVEDEMRRVQVCSNRLCEIMRLDLPSQKHFGCDGRQLASQMASICFIPEAFEESTDQLVEANASRQRELIYLADMRIIERDYSPLALDNRPRGHLWVYRDVTQREQSKDLLQRQADQLRALSLVDELTGLYNRRGFLTLATQQLKLCDRTMRPALVVFVDLDGMKRINDELGHDFGDQALIETASTLRHCFRYSDVVARLGGDEFVALAIDAAQEMIGTIQQRLYERLAELNAKPGRRFELQFSVGTAAYDPSRAEMIEEVLARADGLMYEQKRARKAQRQA
jgi:diguanylate cyclase (GGDEF)-like protein